MARKKTEPKDVPLTITTRLPKEVVLSVYKKSIEDGESPSSVIRTILSNHFGISHRVSSNSVKNRINHLTKMLEA